MRGTETERQTEGLRRIDFAQESLRLVARIAGQVYRIAVDRLVEIAAAVGEFAAAVVEVGRVEEPLRTETMTLNGKEYTASYFGEYDISQIAGYKTRKFWRIEDAYDDLKDLPKTGEILPYNNFPMEVKEGQIFVIEYLRTDGTTYRTTYRSDGRTVGGLPATEAVNVEWS